MSKIKIITDSACDIELKVAEKNHITMLPFTITMGQKEYKECYDFSKNDFYNILRNSDEIPTTAQITPFIFEEIMQKSYNENITDLIIVPINKSASATFNSAVMAKNNFTIENPDSKMKIYIINTTTYTYGYGYPILCASQMIKNGVSIHDILKYLEDWFLRFELYFTVFDLKFAKKSGRIGNAAAIAGELLGIKPIICLTNGNSKNVKKVRGISAGIIALVSIAKEKMNLNKDYILLTGDNEKEARELLKLSKETFKQKPLEMIGVGAAIAINAGPELIGIGFLGEKRTGKKIVY